MIPGLRSEKGRSIWSGLFHLGEKVQTKGTKGPEHRLYQGEDGCLPDGTVG